MSSPRPRSDSPGSSPARPTPAGASGATPATRKRRPWWLWALLAAVVLAILVISLVQCSGNGNPSNTAAAPSDPAAGAASAGAPSAAAPGVGAGSGAGTLTAAGTALLPLAHAAGSTSALTGQVGKAVTARGVLVQSVPADEGFWVGENDTDRIWVQLNGGGESGYTVKQGDRVDFTGTMTAHDPAFAGQVGVDDAEGAGLLTAEAAHVATDKSALALHTG